MLALLASTVPTVCRSLSPLPPRLRFVNERSCICLGTKVVVQPVCSHTHIQAVAGRRPHMYVCMYESICNVPLLQPKQSRLLLVICDHDIRCDGM